MLLLHITITIEWKQKPEMNKITSGKWNECGIFTATTTSIEIFDDINNN